MPVISAGDLLDETAKLDIDNPEHRVSGMHRLCEAVGEISVYLNGWASFEDLVRTFRVYFLQDELSILRDFNDTGLLIAGPVYDVPNDMIYALILTPNGRLYHWETRVRVSTRQDRASNPGTVYAITAVSSGFNLLTAHGLNELIRGPLGTRLFANSRRTILELLEAAQTRVMAEIYEAVSKARRVDHLFS